MATMLFESPQEIAWCYAFLTPIYLSDEKWALARSSLANVIASIDEPDVRKWAGGLITSVSHMMVLQPDPPVERNTDEFNQMRDFVAKWNKGANSNRPIKSMISRDMNVTRMTELSTWYLTIRKAHPSVMFNNSLQAVGISGSDLLLTVRIQAAFSEPQSKLPTEIQDLVKDGRMRYFRVSLVKNDWQVVDWEDAPYPMESMRLLLSLKPEMGSEGNRIPFGGG
jgi:hypothetical protein